MAGELWRQGDVLIERLTDEPGTHLQDSTATHSAWANGAVLAEGEVTGHKHMLRSDEPNSVRMRSVEDTGETLLELHTTGQVEHDEHYTLSDLPSGDYRIRQQMEGEIINPERKRQVRD